MTIRINNKIIGAAVSDAVLTLVSKGNELGTFSANATENKTIDLNIPTKLSECMDDLGSSPVHTHNQYSKNIVQLRTDLTAGSNVIIYLNNLYTIYSLTPNQSTSVAFDTSNVNVNNNETITFELKINMNTLYTITFPNLKWQDNEAPEMTEIGTYYFAFRSDDQGATWIGNLQGLWN